MAGEDSFNIRLGRIYSPTGTAKFSSFAGRVRRAAQNSGKRRSGARQKSTAVPLEYYSRRVIIKVNLVRMGGQGYATQKLHVDYIKRDSAALEGDKGNIYSKDQVFADSDEFIENGKDDRHQFRIIVSPEDGKEIGDLSLFTKNFMAQMERDLDTKLEWVAANHYDTANPHTHIVIRGKRDNGDDLVIPKKYISYGMREVAEDLATRELGPVAQIDVAKKLALQIRQERFTSIDRDLLAVADNNIVNLTEVKQDGSDWSQRFKTWRVKHLARMGLAEKVGWGRWRLDDRLERTLRRLGERGDILKAYHRSMSKSKLERPTYGVPIYDPADALAKPITGRVISKGILDDVNDRSFVVLDTTHGEAIFVETGREANIVDIEAGMIVKVGPRNYAPMKSDYTIAEIAGKRGGVYSPSVHEMSDPSAREEFIKAHVRRLEAMRRAGHAERNADGSWKVTNDYLKRAAAYETSRGFGNPVALDIVSKISLKDLPQTIGKTWLDSEMMSGEKITGAAGFGQDAEEAKLKRHQFLRSQNVISRDGRVTDETLATLESMDLDRAGKSISAEIDKPYKRAPESGRISGTYVQSIDRPSGKYAVLEKSKEFTLVPWRATMDRNLGKSISGLVKGQAISWTLTKGIGRNIS